MKMLAREKRNMLDVAGFLLMGTIMMISGVILLVISFPLMLILIGFGTALIAFYLTITGFHLINIAFYKPIFCEECRKMINPSTFKDDVRCSSCKTFYTFRNGK